MCCVWDKGATAQLHSGTPQTSGLAEVRVLDHHLCHQQIGPCALEHGHSAASGYCLHAGGTCLTLKPHTAAQVDAACAALAGHSYGGLTVGALTAEEPAFSCGVAIDPWW